MRRALPVLSLILLFAACSRPDPLLVEPPPAVPKATRVGTATGDAVTQTIGPEGGSLTSADGRLALKIPAGAVAAATGFGIQPITNEAWGGRGVAYRLTPDGQRFAAPVELAFHYSEEDLLGTTPRALAIGFQQADGFWRAFNEAALDAGARRIAVLTDHFSDWSLLAGFQLSPVRTRVKAGKRVDFSVTWCGRKEEVPASLVAECVTADPDLPFYWASDWQVNGAPGGGDAAGTIQQASLVSATYTAPSRRPHDNPVHVSALRTVSLTGEIDLLVAEVTVEAECDSTPGGTGIPCRWKGTSSFDVPALGPVTADIVWEFDELDDDRFATYLGTGTVLQSPAVDCAPNVPSHPVDPDVPGRLIVDFSSSPPTYSGAGATTWNSGWTCTDEGDQSLRTFAGGGWFSALTGGPYLFSADGQSITGSNGDFSWSFVRD